jgi:hypothetical protein
MKPEGRRTIMGGGNASGYERISRSTFEANPRSDANSVSSPNAFTATAIAVIAR